MRKGMALLTLLVLATLHGPTQAQALVYSWFPDLLTLGASEPATLFVTGMALLTLARIGTARR